MIDFSRRQVVQSGMAAAALGLSGSLTFLPAAQAASVREKGYYSYKVGDIEVISLYDGIWKKSHDENFAVGGTIEEQKAALRNAGLTDEHVPIEFAYTIVKSGGETILIDAGTGGQLAPSAGLGSKGMEAAGIKKSDIKKILISHLHPDHIFGLMNKDNSQVFPDAEIMVGETEFNFWNDPGLIAKLPEFRKPLGQRIQATIGTWKNVTQFGDDADLGNGIKAKATHGHTPGHTAFHLSSGNDQTLIIGDLLIVPALFLANLDWQVFFDSDKDQATKTRKKIVDMVVSDGITISGYHFGFPNSGKIEKDGDGFVFNPASA